MKSDDPNGRVVPATAAATAPAMRTYPGLTVQPRRIARSVSATPSVPAASPVAARPTARYGFRPRSNAQGGWPWAPGSGGSISDGPAAATATVQTMLTAVAASPARPVRAAEVAGRAATEVTDV